MITEISELLHAVKMKLPDYLQEQGISDPFKKFTCLSKSHNDSHPSMQLHKDGKFIKCFSCERSFDIFSLAHELEDKPIDGDGFLKENVYYLADKFGIKYNIVSSNSEKIALKQNYLRAYKIVADYIEKTTADSATDAFEREIKKRKWKKKESIELGLGCVKSFSDVINVLKVNGFSSDFIDLVGLNRRDLFSEDNVLFTIYDQFSRPIAFYARDTRFEEKKLTYENRDKFDASNMKMPMKFNSTANFTGIYEKSTNPYGIHDIKNFHKAIVVEGHGCKHSLRLSGIDNVIALGGLAFNEQLVDKLVKLGVTNLVFILDNDDKGQEKLKNIVRQYYGKLPLELSVIDIASSYSDIKDPDEFLRKYSVEAFKQLIEKNALEWYAVNELFEKGDAYVVLQDIIPIIALERSPINRRRIESIISDITGIDKQDIHDEVEQKITLSKDRKGEVALKVLDEAKEILISNPSAIDAVTNLINNKLTNINKTSSDEDLYSSNEVLRELAKMQDQEDAGVEAPIIKTGWEEFDKAIQLPPEEAFCLLPASPNSGKSTKCISLANGILDNNDNVMVIIHTTDDSRNVYFNRLVANRTRVKMNWLKRPGHYLNDELKQKRNDAYKVLTEYIRNDRLIIKDVIHGDTVEYHGKLIQHYREKYPNRHIFVICDNLHRLNTEAEFGESRQKYKYISAMMKSYTTKYQCIEWCTVEMNKMGMYEKHTTPNTIAEAASLQFDANLIVFLWNEINALREQAVQVFNSTIMEFYPELGYVHKPIIKPIIEALVLKNKLTEFKGSLYYKFHPEIAVYDSISYQEFKEIIEANKKEEE